jgi:hypothetical protein
MKLLTTRFSKSLGVHVGRTLVPTITINLNFGLKSACFSDTVLFTKATSASMFLPTVLLSLAMLFLMRLFFCSQHFRVLPRPRHNTLHLLCLVKLKMLHTLLCCCLIMVQVSVEELIFNLWISPMCHRHHRLPRNLNVEYLPRLLHIRPYRFLGRRHLLLLSPLRPRHLARHLHCDPLCPISPPGRHPLLGLKCQKPHARIGLLAARDHCIIPRALACLAPRALACIAPRALASVASRALACQLASVGSQLP